MNSATLSKARLARLHDVMAGYVERGELPGLVALVSRRGDTHVEALGVKALGESDPVQRDTIFRIASIPRARAIRFCIATSQSFRL
jgi:CubicO group peptidase (beta-lactamase class C family)